MSNLLIIEVNKGVVVAVHSDIDNEELEIVLLDADVEGGDALDIHEVAGDEYIVGRIDVETITERMKADVDELLQSGEI
jgi:hypothetical protein